jgi:hypothetical protein
MSTSDNKRGSFRLDDMMKLHVKMLEPAALAAILSDFDAYRMRYCLKSHLRNQTEIRQPKLQLIRKRDAEVAQYLEHLEAQIAQLAARLSDDSDMEFDARKLESPVNISATGLRFIADIEASVGQQLELGMLLSTSGTQLVVIGEVVRVEALKRHSKSEDTPQWQVSTQFVRIHPDDTEAIIRHMAKLQQLQLQARRAG